MIPSIHMIKQTLKTSVLRLLARPRKKENHAILNRLARLLVLPSPTQSSPHFFLQRNCGIDLLLLQIMRKSCPVLVCLGTKKVKGMMDAYYKRVVSRRCNLLRPRKISRPVRLAR